MDDGEEVPFDRLLIASGARPWLPAIESLAGPGIHFLWTLEDADRLNEEFLPERRVAFIGSGFVSMQGAWSACSRGLKVSVLEAMPRILPRVLDAKGSALLEDAMKRQGVEVRVSVGIERVERLAGGRLRILMACEGEPVEADLIVVGAGVRPCLEFLQGTAVEVREGILVDERMRTTAPDIWAAGDVALGPSVFGEPHASHALWPTAVEQGKVAGANMAGQGLVYRGSLNMNVAEMFGLTVASLGRCEESGKGIVRKEMHDRKAGRYVMLLSRDGVPVGGVVVGVPEDLAALAAVRPSVRARREAQSSPGLPFADLHRRLAHSFAGRS
jgi:nitrite reductase (NADH) large subunit